MKKNLSILALMFLQFCLFGCRNNQITPPSFTDLTLSVKMAASTDAVLSIHTDANDSISICLRRDGDLVLSNQRIYRDFLVYDSLLQPNHQYTYSAYKVPNINPTAPLAQVQLKTMDTTSHEYAWRTFEFGEVDRSMFNDVAIINENDIWAVGEIYYADPLGVHVYLKYGAMHWDGKSWVRKQLTTDDYVPGLKSDIWPVGIYAIDTNDIWFGNGGVMHYLNGTIQSFWLNDFPGSPSPILDPGQAIWKVCGTSASSILAIGAQGALAFYNGVAWKKLETLSAYDVSDACGIRNPQTGTPEFYCSIEGDLVDPSLSKLIKIKDNAKVETVAWGMDHSAISLWTKTGFPLYVAGGRGGIYTNKTGSWSATSFGEENVMDGIRGNDVNDIMVIGGFGLVAHYNGATWRRYPELGQHNERYLALYMTEHLAAIVGYRGGKAIISIGKR
jgi:hypothetical protein